MTKTSEAVVREMLASWNTSSVDTIMEFFAEDCVYHNMPHEPWVGARDIRVALERFVPFMTFDFEVLKAVAHEDCVFTERVDRFAYEEEEVVLPVVGVFEVLDGKITGWRDYFDMTPVAKLMAALAARE